MKKRRDHRLGGGPIIPRVCDGPGEPGLVSVLIPSYNRGYIVGSAIESVLAQTYHPVEIVVVDDGSTDDTRQVVGRYGSKVRYIHQENAGIAAARNAGLGAARGEFVAFLDSDDVWLPWKLGAQVAIMRQVPEVALVCTDMSAVDPAGEVIREKQLSTTYDVYRKIRLEDHLRDAGRLGDVYGECPPALAHTSFRYGDIFSAMFLGNMVHPPTALLRRQHVQRTGGLDLAFSWTCEDYEFFWRVSREGPVALIEAPSMFYRVNADDMLSRPALHLFIARGNLVALEQRLEQDRDRIQLPSRVIRRHLAEAYRWVAEEEMSYGQGSAAGYVCRSLRLEPTHRRTLFMLPLSLLPRSLFRWGRSIRQRLRESPARRGEVGVRSHGARP